MRTICTPATLTIFTAGAACRPCIHTGGAGVVTQVTLAARLVLPLGAVCHAAAVIQSPASRTATKTQKLCSVAQNRRTSIINGEKKSELCFCWSRGETNCRIRACGHKARRKTWAIGLHQSRLIDSPPNDFFQLNGSFCFSGCHQRWMKSQTTGKYKSPLPEYWWTLEKKRERSLDV